MIFRHKHNSGPIFVDLIKIAHVSTFSGITCGRYNASALVHHRMGGTSLSAYPERYRKAG